MQLVSSYKRMWYKPSRLVKERVLSVYIQMNLDMTDSMGPGKLVRHIHMTNT